MGDRFELRGQDRRRLHEAISDAEDALLEIDSVASGERKATPEAIARGLRSILKGQVALMEALLGAGASPAASAPHASATAEEGGVGPAQFRRRPLSDKAARAAAFASRIGKGFQDDDEEATATPATRLRPPSLDSGDDDDDDMRALAAAQPIHPKTPSAPAPEDADPAVRAGGPSAEALRTFPLEEINRWLASGTVFQIRGAIAFLNMASMGGKIDEMSGHIRRMGFADEVGRLEAEGLASSVLLFRRPE